MDKKIEMVHFQITRNCNLRCHFCGQWGKKGFFSDASGNNIFADAENIGVPAKIGFAVSQDLYILLKRAEYLELDLVLAPRGSTVPSEDYIIVTSATLRDYIDAQTITVEEDVIVEEEDEKTDEVTDNTQTQPIS